MKYSLIIPTVGKTSYLEHCIASIEHYFREPNFEVIVVNDGANETELQIYCRDHNLTCICNPENKGFSHTVNTGLRAAKGEILILCNNDITFTDSILEKIDEVFKLDPKIGILGALLYYPNNKIQHCGVGYSEPLDSFIHVQTITPTAAYFPAVTGALFIFKRELLQTVGFLNEDYFLACEDTDYCLRAWTKGYRVFLDPSISAIHHEGATRGSTAISKVKASKDWTIKEQRSIVVFKQKLKTSFDLPKILETVAALNPKVPLKIEVGSGYSPHPGYKHLDIRAGLPQLDYICDFSTTKLPFKNEEVSEILANHVIEHISFRKLPFVVSEWQRVLVRGGKLTLRTPDLRFICEKYLKGETTKEWPGDEEFIKNNLSYAVTPSWWANIKLFSGQDYESNFHHVCFDFDMLRELLQRYGFTDIRKAKFEVEFSPGELQVEAFNGKKRVLIDRRGALGDVILTTSIVKRFYDDGWEVDVVTRSEEVFKDNPCAKASFASQAALSEYNKIVDLNLAYETRPKMHIIDAYSLEAFGDTNTKKNTYLFRTIEGETEASKLLQGLRLFIAIHMGVGWENRTWPEESWHELLDMIPPSVPIVLVGARTDFQIDTFGNILNLVGKTDFHTLCSVLARAKLFIGVDSAPLHVAQAFAVPSIGIYTSAKAEYRALNVLAVTPKIDCYGCLHEEKPPAVYCGCRRKDFKCLELITPEEIFKIVEAVL